MIRPSNNAFKIYLYQQPVDMRKQSHGLAAIVESQMALDTFSKSLFVFVNKRRNTLKILYWEKNGYVIWHKKLEKDRFHWFKSEAIRNMTIKELNMLLDGYDVFKFKPHQQIILDKAS